MVVALGIDFSWTEAVDAIRSIGFPDGRSTVEKLLPTLQFDVASSNSRIRWTCPFSLHRATLRYASQDGGRFQALISSLRNCYMIAGGNHLRLACYFPDIFTGRGFGRSDANPDWAADYFLEVEPAFVAGLSPYQRTSVLLSMGPRLWLSGYWPTAFRELVEQDSGFDLKALALELAMFSDDAAAVKKRLTSDLKKLGYESTWLFLKGEPKEAYLQFVKLASRRKEGVSFLPPIPSIFARLAAWSQGDMRVFEDRRFFNAVYQGLSHFLNLVGDVANGRTVSEFDWRQNSVFNQSQMGLELCLRWLFRHLLPGEMELPPSAAERLQGFGLQRFADQLASKPERSWVLAPDAEEPWQQWLRILDTQADLEEKKNAAGKAVELESFLAWQLTQEEIIFYQQTSKACALGTGVSEEPPTELFGKHANSKALLQRLPEYLSEQDRIALSKVKLSNYGQALPNAQVLRHLIGHPRLYFKRSRCQLVERTQHLHLYRAPNGGFLLNLEPAIPPRSDFLFESVSDELVTFWVRSPWEKHLLPLVTQDVEIPSAAEAQLRAVLHKWLPKIEVTCGEGIEPFLESEFDLHRVVLRAVASGSGMRFNWVVKSEHGDFWRLAGQGFDTERLVHDGKAVVLTRNVVQERRLIASAVERCPLLPEETKFRLEDPQQILELLHECRDQAIDVDWPEGKAIKVRSTATQGALKVAVSQSPSGEGDWFSVDGHLMLDDQTQVLLSQALMEGRLEGRFLQLGENDYIRLEEDLRQQLAALSELVDQDGKELKVSALVVPSLAQLEIDGLSCDQAFSERLERFRELSNYQPQVPKMLQAELRDYQLEGFRWLARHAKMGSGACLADDMGLGKTVQTISVLLHRRADGCHLVVCPVSVMSQWAEQITTFAPSLRPVLYEGKERDREWDQLGSGDVLICSYRVLLMDGEKFKSQSWGVVVLDEAQAIKNPEAKTARIAFQLRGKARLATTGTPIENRLSELWSIFNFINPGLLGSLSRFRQRYEAQVEAGKKCSRLRSLVAPFMLRRLKSQVLSELPPRTEMVLLVDLSEEERSIYEKIRQEARQDIEKKEAFQLLAHLTRLRQACCHPRLLMKNRRQESSKVAALLELVDDLRSGNHRALVFSQFTSFLDLVEEQFQRHEVSYLRLDGSTSSEDRRRRVQSFQAGEGDVFLISLKAGGAGLNLTGADFVIHLDPWWNPAVEDQASDRAHRIGQTRPVTVYRLIANDTIEQKVVKLHGEKRKLAESVLEGRDTAVPLDVNELRQLLELA